jgi:hypothetical protein
MPTLNLDDTTKRFIAPSTANEPDQGYVEMTTYPICADDYVNIMGRTNDPTINVNGELLARRIKDWNYTDPTGVKLEISAKACSRLPVDDQLFFINCIESKPSTEVGDEEKKASTSTSSAEPTASPQI